MVSSKPEVNYSLTESLKDNGSSKIKGKLYSQTVDTR
jgi:hypothetical protein